MRLASFVAISSGQIPQASWFALGRQLATLEGKTVLLSWSGSMFEYLMPMLVMPSYENTLLDETMRGAVERQVRYGRQRGVPWGISESGYNTTDAHLNYQYRAFGVPGLGLKRGLAADLVVAPYATMMALMVDPKAAVLNLARLAGEGLASTYGFYEAIDYTPSRLPRGEKSAVVRSHMAHHQGMALLALAYLLLDRPMQRRFASDPALQATLLLLQERVPRAVPFHPEMTERVDFRSGQPTTETPLRVIATPHTPSPEVQLLSNGRYHVMLTNSGAGYSRWKDVAVTRWREDGTTDAWGSFCYLRDTETGTFWSTTPQPTLWPADSFEAIFSEGRAEFRRRDQGIDAYTRGGGLSRRRHRAAAPAADQPQPLAPQHRIHHLHGGGDGTGRRRCGAPGLQQAVRADRGAGAAVADPLLRAGRARRRSSRHGCSTSSPCTRSVWGRRRTRPTARASSAVAAARTRRPRCEMQRRCRGRAGRCSTRSRRPGG